MCIAAADMPLARGTKPARRRVKAASTRWPERRVTGGSSVWMGGGALIDKREEVDVSIQ